MARLIKPSHALFAVSSFVSTPYAGVDGSPPEPWNQPR